MGVMGDLGFRAGDFPLAQGAILILAVGFKRANSTGAFAGMFAGMAVILWVATYTKIAFLWHNLIGAVVVFVVGMIVSEVTGPRKA